MKGVNRLLAEQHGLGTIRICECGSINLNIGAVTLHLAPDTFLKASAMLRHAASEYAKLAEVFELKSGLSQETGTHPDRFTN